MADSVDMADDYLSRLPESLIHHIISFIRRPSKEICRICVLSKYFNTVWCNYPNLDFSFTDPFLINSIVEKPEEDLLDRMENSLGQCLNRRASIQQLSLQIKSMTDLTTKLDGWLGDSVDKNVSRLVLKLDGWMVIRYSVPHQVLVSRRLQVLDLFRCTFKEDSFVRIELPCLEKLCLSSCDFVGDNLLQKILCASPKMKHLSLKHCRGLENSLSISCTPLLKHFSFTCLGDYFERIKVDAPNLHTFSCDFRLNHEFAIDLTTCTNLKELYLHNIVATVLEQLQSIFLGIQVLELNRCDFENIYKISSPSLKRLIIHNSDRLLNNMEIDAPNLQSFEFSLEYYPRSMSKFKFSSWSIPKAYDIYMKFSARSFQEACKKGLQDFLMKLPNYEDLKLFIFNLPTVCNSFMIKELHAVSISSLQTIGINSRRCYWNMCISSRDETDILDQHLRYAASTKSMICSSWESAKSFHKKLENLSIVKQNFGHIELVSPADIKMCSAMVSRADKEMFYAWKSFVKSNSGGVNDSVEIILHAVEGHEQY